jgi:hypothetical protein
MRDLIISLSTGASLASFLLAIHLLVKDRGKRSIQLAWGYFSFFILCSILLLCSGYFYTKHITTLTQTGFFIGNISTTNEIFYPIPYMTNPNLSFHIMRRRGTADSDIVLVLEQRPDGFKAQTGDRLTEHWEWEAEGISIEVTNKDTAVSR